MSVFATLFRLTGRLPLGFLQGLGAPLGWLAWLGSPTYRRQVRAQVDQAGVPWPAARPAVAEAGRMVAELPWLWARPAGVALGARVQWQGEALIAEALGSGRGLVMLTPHLGCFEVIAQAYAERFGAVQPMTALYRPARIGWLRELMADSRDRPGLLTAPATLAGVRQMIRALRSGGTIGLLPDQVPPEGMGVWAPWFGRPAYTMTLAARLVQQTGAAWLLLSCVRLPRGQGFQIRVEAPAEALPAGTGEADTLAAAGVINRAMEGLVRSQPGQYLWGYNRYKNPRQIGSSAAGAAS